MAALAVSLARRPARRPPAVAVVLGDGDWPGVAVEEAAGDG
jgi:hypothetical protein